MSAENTADNPGRIVFVISWFLFCVIWLTVGTRMVTRWTLTCRFEGDDIVTWIALLLGSAQTAAVTVAIYNGLGQNIATLSASQISHFQQSLYASDILSVWTLSFSKIAVLLLLVQVTPIESHLRLAFGVGIFVLLWALSAFLVVAFGCHLPHAWQFIGNQCVNRAAFWTSFGILNIVTDLMLILLPTFMFFRLHVLWHRKATIIACFASRFLVIVAAICQLVYSRHIYHSTNPTSDIWKAALCGQVVQNLSIVTSCVPYLKPFYLGLESGLMQSNDPHRTNSRKFMSAYTYSDAYAYAYHRHKPDPIAQESSGSNGKSPPPERDNTIYSDHGSVIELYDLSGYLNEGHADEDNLTQALIIRYRTLVTQGGYLTVGYAPDSLRIVSGSTRLMKAYYNE